MELSKEILLKLYGNQNLTIQQIADKFEMHHTAISKLIKKYDLNYLKQQHKNHKTNSITKELILNAYINLKYIYKVAKELKISEPIVLKLLKKYNIPKIHDLQPKIHPNKPSKDEFIKTYLIDNLTKKDCMKKFNVTEYTFNEWRKEFEVEKSKDGIQIKGIRSKPINLVDKRRKREKTCLEKYGETSYFKTKEFQVKSQNTNFKRYGTKHGMQSKIVQEKRQNTCLERYGVKHPNQNEKILKKAQKIRTKIANLPSGKQINYQGYELKVINLLLENGIKESDILLETDVPHFKYFWENSNRTYKPDIFLNNFNLIIEVKSDYTLFCDMNKNIAKAEIVLESDYNFQFWVLDKNLDLSIITLGDLFKADTEFPNLENFNPKEKGQIQN